MSVLDRVRRHGVWLAGTAFLLLSWSIIFSLRPWCDEGWNASPALNLLNHGYLGASSIETVTLEKLQGIDRHWYTQTPLYPVALAGWFAIAGQGLIEQRLFTLLQGVVLLVSFFILLRLLWRVPQGASMAVAVLCVDYFFVRRSADGRYDMLCACLGFAGLAAYMALRERSGPLAILAGAAGVVGAVMSHVVGVVYGVQLVFLVVWYDWRRIRWTWLLAAIAPAMVAALLWGRFILQAPEDFYVQFTHEMTDRTGILWHPIQGTLHELQTRYLFALGGIGEGGIYNPLRQIRGLILVVYLAGMGVVFASRRLRQKWDLTPVIWLWAISAGLILVLDNGHRPLYLVHILPWMAAMLAAAIAWIWREWPKLRWTLAAVLAAFVLVQVGGILYIPWHNERARVFEPVANYLRQNLKPGETVMGGPEWGYAVGFGDQLVDDTCLGYFSKKVPAYIVMDPRYHGQLDGLRQGRPEIPRFADELLRTQYTLVKHVGVLEVYRHRSDVAVK